MRLYFEITKTDRINFEYSYLSVILEFILFSSSNSVNLRKLKLLEFCNFEFIDVVKL